MNVLFVSDYTIKEMPFGGSEWVNQVIIDYLQIPFEYSKNIKGFDKNTLYIISNVSMMEDYVLESLKSFKYIIIEHDYKICQSRHPWKYKNCIVPENERIHYDLYKNAIAVFVQTTDHMNVFLKNSVTANFVNLKSSIWREDDLVILESLLNINNERKNKYVIYNTNNWIKNTVGAVQYCKDYNLQYEFIENMSSRYDFLSKLSNYIGIVFFPVARETFCRLVVEARCLNMKVITTKNYGALLENWFDYYSGMELINFLRYNTNKNIEIIKSILKENS